ncbi:MAG: GIY-YIG nuclease family protein [Fibrobacter sp.]|nr:GIY-YIG nuclease family protein [Fibrobacter sp.]
MPTHNEHKSTEWIVYILQCNDNTFYTGITNNLQKRIELHNTGKGARYTRGRSPFILVFSEKCATKSIALKREYAIKQLSREEKEALISG